MISINGIPAESVGLEVGRSSLRKRARQNYEVINIPGKLTPNIVPLSSYSPVSIAVPADLFDYSRIDEVYKWLGTGKAVLIDEREPDKYRVGYCFEEVTVDCYNEEMCSLAFNFVCEPFLYKVDEEPVTVQSSDIITNSGTVYAEPVINLVPATASSASLTIGGTTLEFPTAEDVVTLAGKTVTIDCGRKLVYYTDDSGAMHNIIDHTNGSLFSLPPGSSKDTYKNLHNVNILINTRWY